MDWQAAGAAGQRTRNEVFQSPDFQEGIRAFREKRPPKWPSSRKSKKDEPPMNTDEHG
jgi:hypothetical protein